MPGFFCPTSWPRNRQDGPGVADLPGCSWGWEGDGKKQQELLIAHFLVPCCERNSIKASFSENSRLLFWEINAISFLFFSCSPPALTGKRITFESSSKSYSYIFGCSHPCDQILKVKVENQCQGGGAELCKGYMNETLSATNQEWGWKSKSYYGTTIWTLFWNCEKSIWKSR